tara:strand:- start:246 stop:539 length:294 start_codon:yes stop_codon:yes gene_type:complete
LVLTVAFKISEDSNTKGIVNISTDELAVSDCVFSIVASTLLELSNTSKDIVGVLPVLFVTLIDLIIIVSLVPAVRIDVSVCVDKLTPKNLYELAIII